MNIYLASRLNRQKTILIREKGGKCQKCGRKGHPSIFDFHHRTHSKEFTISSMRNLSLSKLREEIEKCDLLCACCHRLEHISASNWDFDFDKPDFATPKQPKLCKCGKKVKTGKFFCSSICRAQAQETINWPKNLPELVLSSSQSAVARTLGVSDKAVEKRLRNHHPRN